MLRLQVESETDPGMTRGKKRKKKGWYHINLNKEWCAMKSRIPYLGEGTENIDKKGEKKQKKYQILLEGGNSNDIAHRSLIQVNTVLCM